MNVRSLAAAAAALWYLGPAAAADAPAIVDIVENGAYRVAVVRGEAGTLFDLGKGAPLAPDDRIALSRDGADITGAAQIARPVVRVAYLFRGLDEAAQCRFRTLFDSILGQAGGRVSAYADRPNRLCPELGIEEATDPAARAADLAGGYSRMLGIEVADNAPRAAPVTGIWSLLMVSPVDIADKTDLLGAVRRFVAGNLNGAFVWLPASETPGGARVSLEVAGDGGPQISATVTYPRAFVDYIRRDRAWPIGAGAAAVALLLLLVLALRRKRPERELVVGYGDGCDVTLGAGERQQVLRLRVFNRNRIEAVTLSRDETVTVNGRRVKGKAWLKPDDDIRIAGKKVVFI